MGRISLGPFRGGGAPHGSDSGEGAGAAGAGRARRFFELAEELIRPDVRTEAERIAAEAAQHRALFYAMVKQWWDKFVAGRETSEAEEGRLIQTMKRLVNETIRGAQRMFPYLRMRALWEEEPINRVYRDLITSAHAIDLVRG